MGGSQEPARQSHGVQDSSDLEIDMTSDDDDGTASESSKGQITDLTQNYCKCYIHNFGISVFR